MTALETYVKDKKRQDYIKQVRKKIDKLGIEYIYYQFISVTGRIVGTVSYTHLTLPTSNGV